jgi:hypothetical protein
MLPHHGSRVVTIIQVLAGALLTLCVTSRAVNVTGTMGVLTYTLGACPIGWDDQALNDPYRGRMVKGWNPANGVGIGATTGGASTGNDVFSHSHARWALRLNLRGNPIGKPMYSSLCHSNVASDVNFLTEANSALNSSTARIPRKSSWPSFLVS